jgi:hypothetical protein
MERSENERPGCLGYILQLLRSFFSPALKEGRPLPYRVRDDFLSTAELSYFQVLRSVLGSKATICAKVRLADLLFVTSKPEYMRYFNKIVGKHIDYLICDRSTMRPVLAIELDDSSHSRQRSKERDRFINDALAAASFPLLRVRAQQQYSQQQVIDQVKPYLLKPEPVQQEEKVAEPVAAKEAPSKKQIAAVPSCPKCEIPMVLRVATKGKNKGRRFYGCSNYPQCRELLPVPVGGS